MENNEINNNEQQYIIDENKDYEPKKKFSLLKVLLVVLITVCMLVIAVFGFYKATVDISDKNASKFDYNFSDIVTPSESDYVDFLTFDSKVDPNTLFVEIPKDYVYNNIIDIQSFANEFNNKTQIRIKRIGTMSNAQNANLIDFYGDISFKDLINAYVSGSIRYEITNDNNVNFYIEKFVIGDGLPMFFYKAFLPFNDGDLIYTIKAEDFELLKDKTLDLNMIHNIKLDSNSLNFIFDYMSNMKNIGTYILGENSDKLNTTLENILPIILEITIGENKEEYLDMAEILLPMIINNVFN